MPRHVLLLHAIPSNAALQALLSKSLYDDAQEHSVHANQVQTLARETSQPLDVVRFRYENALLHLKPNARVRTFLPIFIARCLKRLPPAQPEAGPAAFQSP